MKYRNERDGTFEQCVMCGAPVRYGNALLEVNRMEEQCDTDAATGSCTSKIIDDTPLAIFCAGCANRLANRQSVRQRLVQLLGVPAPVLNGERYGCNETDNIPKTCNCCGIEMASGMTRITVSRRIAQVDWSDERGDAVITTIDAEDIFIFCAACGISMNKGKLKEAIRKMIVGVRPTPATTDDMTEKEREKRIYETKSRILENALKRVRELGVESGT